jgi:hypothetical protein
MQKRAVFVVLMSVLLLISVTQSALAQDDDSGGEVSVFDKVLNWFKSVLGIGEEAQTGSGVSCTTDDDCDSAAGETCQEGICVGNGGGGGGGGGNEECNDITCEWTCGDGIDNDGDGATDCLDSDCVANSRPSAVGHICCSSVLDCVGKCEHPEAGCSCNDGAYVSAYAHTCWDALEFDCGDGEDNDGNVAWDCWEPLCAGAPNCAGNCSAPSKQCNPGEEVVCYRDGKEGTMTCGGNCQYGDCIIDLCADVVCGSCETCNPETGECESSDTCCTSDEECDECSSCNTETGSCISSCSADETCDEGVCKDCMETGTCDSETICDDGEDNDGDGATDCSDIDCFLVDACKKCGNGNIDSGEECDGSELGGKSCSSFGYTEGTLSCDTNCNFDKNDCRNAECGNNKVESGETCDGGDLNGASCESQGYKRGTLACYSDCYNFDVSGCENNYCGDNVINGNEECDGGDLGSSSCSSFGYNYGTLACDANCFFDKSDCRDNECGNNKVESGETCDGGDLNGASCESQGYKRGTLACYSDCYNFDVSGCENNYCGDNVINGNEECDGSELGGYDCSDFGFNGGTLKCVECGFDTSDCTESECTDDADCEDDDPCTDDYCDDSTKTCYSIDITECIGGDECCPEGCTKDDDSDCESKACTNPDGNEGDKTDCTNFPSMYGPNQATCRSGGWDTSNCWKEICKIGERQCRGGLFYDSFVRCVDDGSGHGTWGSSVENCGENQMCVPGSGSPDCVNKGSGFEDGRIPGTINIKGGDKDPNSRVKQISDTAEMFLPGSGNVVGKIVEGMSGKVENKRAEAGYEINVGSLNSEQINEEGRRPVSEGGKGFELSGKIFLRIWFEKK